MIVSLPALWRFAPRDAPAAPHLIIAAARPAGNGACTRTGYETGPRSSAPAAMGHRPFLGAAQAHGRHSLGIPSSHGLPSVGLSFFHREPASSILRCLAP